MTSRPEKLGATVIVVIAFALLLAPLMAQSPSAVNANLRLLGKQIHLTLAHQPSGKAFNKLHTRASVTMVTAHPDYEDGGMLTYESRGQGARVALLTLNRGEGGASHVFGFRRPWSGPYGRASGC